MTGNITRPNPVAITCNEASQALGLTHFDTILKIITVDIQTRRWAFIKANMVYDLEKSVWNILFITHSICFIGNYQKKM